MALRKSIVAAALAAAAAVASPALAAAATTAASAPAPAASGDSLFRQFHGWGSSKLQAVGLADKGTSLVSFATNRPWKVKTVGSFYGLQGDTSLVGIDYRVQDGLLYGVGNAGGVYQVSAKDATVSKVGQLAQTLSGTSFGVDFNPAANALRVVSDTGQNLRQPFPASGNTPLVPSVADTGLTLPVPPGGTPPAPTATGVSAAAYTNNDLDATTGTTLFDINTALDQVAIQSPANAGTLVATGGLGVDAGPDAGFDIYSKLRNGRTVDVSGFATLSVGGYSRLYSVDLLNGAVDKIGTFPVTVTDIAIPLDQR